MAYVDSPDQASAVVFDFDFNLNYKQIAKAEIYLKDSDCKFFAGATDWVIPVSRPFMGSYIVCIFVKPIDYLTTQLSKH